MSVLTLNSTGKPVNRKVLNFCRNSILGVVNFQKYSVGGYPEQMIDKIWNTVSQDKLNLNSKIAVVNDVCLEATWFLMQKEFSDITLLCTDERIKQYTLSSVNNIYSFDKEITCINVITIEELKSLEQKFDLIIANPPFSIGNDVIRTCLPYCEEAVVLMPISKYKSNKLYQNVETLEMVDDGSFDAQIGGCSCITRLRNTIYETNLDKFELARVTRYKEFFELNYLLPPIYIDHFEAGYAERKEVTYNVNTAFVISLRASTNGVHKSGNDVEYNLHFNPVRVNATSNVYVLKSRAHKENLNRFWYKNSLMTPILNAYNCPSGICELCIPRIDWSVDRDYEHMSYEELLEIMKDELNKQN